MVKIPKQEDRERRALQVRGEEPTVTKAVAVPKSELAMQAKSLVSMRRTRFQLEKKLKDARAKWTLEHKEDLDRLTELKAIEDDIGWRLKQAAINNFTATGDKHPFPGVDVRVNVVPTYDMDVARAWCYAHDLALVFSPKDFEKFARAKPELFDFITWVEQPAGTLASDLAQQITEAEAPEALAESKRRKLN